MSDQNDLVQELKVLKSMVVKMYAQTHGYHWNVEGSNFPQYHKFFLKIYEDVYESIDPIAENIRKLGAKAPFGLKSWMSTSPEFEINDSEDLNARQMLQELVNSNVMVLAQLKKTYDVANELDEQGICNFIAGRQESHKFWQWQLTSTLKTTII